MVKPRLRLGGRDGLGETSAEDRGCLLLARGSDLPPTCAGRLLQPGAAQPFSPVHVFRRLRTWWCPHCQEQRESFGKQAAEARPTSRRIILGAACPMLRSHPSWSAPPGKENSSLSVVMQTSRAIPPGRSTFFVLRLRFTPSPLVAVTSCCKSQDHQRQEVSRPHARPRASLAQTLQAKL